MTILTLRNVEPGIPTGDSVLGHRVDDAGAPIGGSTYRLPQKMHGAVLPSVAGCSRFVRANKTVRACSVATRENIIGETRTFVITTVPLQASRQPQKLYMCAFVCIPVLSTIRRVLRASPVARWLTKLPLRRLRNLMSFSVGLTGAQRREPCFCIAMAD